MLPWLRLIRLAHLSCGLSRCASTLPFAPRKRGFAGGWWWEINPAAEDAQGAYNAVPKDKRVVRQGKKAKAEPAEDKLKEARGTAELATHPAVNAALVIKKFGDHFGDLDVAALAVHLKDAMNDISKNDLSSCEAMLYSQAYEGRPFVQAHRGPRLIGELQDGVASASCRGREEG